MATSEVPEEVQAEFEDSLESDVEAWVKAVAAHVDEFEANEKSDE